MDVKIKRASATRLGWKGLTHRVGLRRVVPNVDVGVVQGLLHGDSGFRVNHQHFGEQVACLTSCHGNTASRGGREEVGGWGREGGGSSY